MIDKKHLDEVCLLGGREKTCRYLTMGQDGFQCVKKEPSLKATLDERGDSMTAQGDNCDGIEYGG